MVGEDHDYALAGSDFSKSLRVFLIDDERILHVGNAPVSGGSSAFVRTKPIGLNSILLPKSLLCAPALASCHFKVQHKAKVLVSNVKWSSGYSPPSPCPGRERSPQRGVRQTSESDLTYRYVCSELPGMPFFALPSATSPRVYTLLVNLPRPDTLYPRRCCKVHP